MNQTRFRQIARLEKRPVAYTNQREAIAQHLQKLRNGAVAHAAVLAFVMRYGNPQIGEPLSEAWRRVAESEARKGSFEPYSRDDVFLMSHPLRHVLLATFPGADEKDKLNCVFKSAPPWLIWFTFADYTAKLLDLNLPDLSSVSGFERSKKIFHGWWALPESAFECRPWPDGADGEPLARTDLSLLGLETKLDAPITNRQRKRARANFARSSLSHQIAWPALLPKEWLPLDFDTLLARLRKAGYFGGDGSRHPEFGDIGVTHPRPRRDY